MHYHEKRGSLCATCQKPINGRCVSAVGQKFHPEHFCCSYCRKQLNKGTFKEVDRKPFCHKCYQATHPWFFHRLWDIFHIYLDLIMILSRCARVLLQLVQSCMFLYFCVIQTTNVKWHSVLHNDSFSVNMLFREIIRNFAFKYNVYFSIAVQLIIISCCFYFTVICLRVRKFSVFHFSLDYFYFSC